jgi:putative methyltransferase (TIGR04325 family)
MPCAAQTNRRDKPVTAADLKIWEGVYPSFDAAPAVGPGFDGPIWRERSLQSARETLARFAAGQPLDYSLRQRNAIMPSLVAMLLSRQARVSFLDFGGGLGTAFVVLSSALGGDIARVDYRIVEVESICRAGRELFATGTRPSFEPELPSGETFDVVQASSSMQYIDDWRSVLRRLAGYRARYLVFCDLLIGDFASYVTLQNYYSSRIRSRFINAGDFIGEVERQGYELALRSACDTRILGAVGPLPMDNFPPQLRVERTSHLLFARAEDR